MDKYGFIVIKTDNYNMRTLYCLMKRFRNVKMNFIIQCLSLWLNPKVCKCPNFRGIVSLLIIES